MREKDGRVGKRGFFVPLETGGKHYYNNNHKKRPGKDMDLLFFSSSLIL